MSDSRERKERLLQEQIGDSAKVTVNISRKGLVYKISCRLGCTDPMSMSTLRSGQGNSYKDALDRWEKHLGWHRVNDAQSGSAQ